MCSVERARALGVPRDRWVFPWAGADAHDTAVRVQPADARRLAGHRVAGRAALELAGIGVDDLAHVDLYSCFPSRGAGRGGRARARHSTGRSPSPAA